MEGNSRCLKANVALDISVELATGVGVFADAETLLNEEVAFDVIAIAAVARIDRVIQLHLKLVGVVNLNSGLNEIFIMFFKTAQTTSYSVYFQVEPRNYSRFFVLVDLCLDRGARTLARM